MSVELAELPPPMIEIDNTQQLDTADDRDDDEEAVSNSPETDQSVLESSNGVDSEGEQDSEVNHDGIDITDSANEGNIRTANEDELPLNTYDQRILSANLINNFLRDGTACGKEIVEELSRVLYHERLAEASSAHLREYDAYLGMRYPSRDAQYKALKQYAAVVRFLQEQSPPHSITDLVDLLKIFPAGHRDPEESESALAWRMTWESLGIPSKMRIRSNTIEGQISEVFPKPGTSIFSRRSGEIMLNITLDDILSVGIVLQATSRIQDHLKLQGTKLFLFTLSDSTFHFLHQYHKNLAASALGISSLGQETIASLNILYDQGRLFEECKRSQLLLGTQGWFYLTVMTSCYEDPPNQWTVLGGRIQTLQRFVESQQSFWPSLKRDIRRQSLQQPIIFWGSIFAVFIGICTLIQTVASVWGLILALRVQ